MSRTILATSLALAAVLASADARADANADCLAAYEKAQVERKEGRLTSARDELLICAQDTCPAVVKKDCTPWLSEVEQALPTVILAARDDSGKDLVDVKVFADGFPFADSLDGTARPLDPGKHVFRFEAPSKPAIEQTVVLREGEKRRAVEVTFADPRPAPVAAPAPVTEPPREPEDSGPSKVPAIGLAALGLAGLGAGVFFGVTAKSDADDLRATCAPACEQSRIDSVETKLLLSDIGIGVGVVALAAATYLFITSSSSSSRSAVRSHAPLRIRF